MPGFLWLTFFWASNAQCESFLSIDKARSLIFPEATRFEERRIELTKSEIETIEKTSGVNVRNKSIILWRSKNEAATAGFVVLDEVLGKHEFITYVAGIETNGNVRQIEILEYRETHGGEIRNFAWRKQFAGKNSRSTITLGKDIQNISGATLSARHITDGVKRLLAIYELKLKNEEINVKSKN